MRRIGIDVGGTNTDAVLLEDGQVAHAVKTPTTPDVTSGIVTALTSLAGHPAVAWVTNDYRAEALSTWRAWDGAEVRYSLHEHAVTVIGVTPTLVLLDDPYFGQRWHSRAEFEAAYGTFGDMAVIIG